MSPFGRAGAVAALAGLGVVLQNPSPIEPAAPNTIGRAQRFLEAAYPDLRSREGLLFRLTGLLPPKWVWLPRFSVLIDPPGPSEVRTTEDLERYWFAATFEFTYDTGEFRRFNAYGQLTNYAKTHGLGAEVEAEVKRHLDWTEAEILAELARRDLRYGPDRRGEMLALVPTAALLDLADDPTLQLVEVVFTLPERDPTFGGLRFLGLRWQLTFRPASGGEVRYIARFEPFGGKLTSFTRFGPLGGG